MTKRNDPAFPQGMPEHGSKPGMTKREYFVAKAMEGMLSGAKIMPGDLRYKRAIEEIIELVDDIFTELEK